MMLQPTKDVLREQLVLAADEIIRLRGRFDSERTLRLHYMGLYSARIGRRWWHRLMWWRK